MEMNWAREEKLMYCRGLIKGHMSQDGPGKQGREQLSHSRTHISFVHLNYSLGSEPRCSGFHLAPRNRPVGEVHMLQLFQYFNFKLSKLSKCSRDIYFFPSYSLLFF